MAKRPLSLADLGPLVQATPPDFPEIWSQIAASLYSCMFQEMNSERAEQQLQQRELMLIARMSIQLTISLANDIGGDTVYIPVGHYMRAGETARKVITAFRGNNHQQVAQDLGITVSRVRQILREYQRSEFEKRQGQLTLD
jgi:Mor family transcriptional regulator